MKGRCSPVSSASSGGGDSGMVEAEDCTQRMDDPACRLPSCNSRPGTSQFPSKSGSATLTSHALLCCRPTTMAARVVLAWKRDCLAHRGI
jgi:hypothetical protein